MCVVFSRDVYKFYMIIVMSEVLFFFLFSIIVELRMSFRSIMPKLFDHLLIQSIIKKVSYTAKDMIMQVIISISFVVTFFLKFS